MGCGVWDLGCVDGVGRWAVGVRDWVRRYGLGDRRYVLGVRFVGGTGKTTARLCRFGVEVEVEVEI